MKTDDQIQEIRSLPVEDRAHAAVRILRSLNRTVSDVDQKWAVLATIVCRAFRLAPSSPWRVMTFLARSGSD
jgi:hypothetical protein